MNEQDKSWLEEKMRLENEIKESSKRTFPLIVTSLIMFLAVLFCPITESQDSMISFTIMAIYQWYITFKMFRFIRNHNKLRFMLESHKNSNPFDK